MLLSYAVVLAIGSVVAAAAVNPGMFIAGHVLQGLATSMLLIAAAPPLTIGFPKEKLRNTAVIMNMCVFGAVAIGPSSAARRPRHTRGGHCSGSSPASRCWP